MTTPTTRARVRTYRHGLGDCHLVTLHAATGTAYRILIDCGVILGTTNAKLKMQQVMDDIISESGGHIDILVATHEHWDHLSGFVQAAEAFKHLRVDQVWLPWTENGQDSQAQALAKDRSRALQLVRDAAAHMQLAGMTELSPLDPLVEFFGAVSGLSTKTALEAVRQKVATPRYCDPKDPPLELQNFKACIYVLGPPRDTQLLKRTLPSKATPETYTLALEACEATLAPALAAAEDDLPFAAPSRIPMQSARNMPFFQSRYFDSDAWRRIDVAWLDDATQLALALDSMTNNTSLVLAIELDAADVLLFAADAQVGNWASWGTCEWQLGTRKVSGTDLVRNTILYKVGHHGSFNATLRQDGLELMQRLRVAIIPVDHAMALKKRWGNIPLQSLEQALEQQAANDGYVLRTDEDPSQAVLTKGVRSTPLYFEVEL